LGSAGRIADDRLVQGPQSPRRLCVGFDAGHLLERGTDVALYDYAEGNEEVLGHHSLILCPAQADVSALDKFRRRFSVCLYRDRTDLEHMLADVDVYYVQDHGARPPGGRARPPHGRTVVHCVFEANEPHGDVYAAISRCVAEQHGVPGEQSCPVVPYIVRQPPPVNGDLRGQLGIPAAATVLGRHGGFDTFDIPFVKEEVVRALATRDDLWFVFLNTRPFAPPHPRLVHLPATVDLVAKARFVRTCDAMLHARAEGETFGLAVAEFSVCHKPVLTWLGSRDMYHAEVLGTKGIYYRGPEDLRRILGLLCPVTGDFDAYSRRFAPDVVMQQFAAVFLGDTPNAVPTARRTHPARRTAAGCG
jgi:hypothetical protein